MPSYLTFSSSVWAQSLLHRFSLVILYANNKTEKAFSLVCCAMNDKSYRSISHWLPIQLNNYEIVVKIFHISHNLTWYSEIVQRFTRISKFCSTYELTKQFMEICVKNCAINLKKNNLYLSYFFAFFISADEDDPINIGVKLMLLSRYGTVTHERGRAYPPNKCAGMLIKINMIL